MNYKKDNKTIIWDLFAHQGVFDLASLEQDANVPAPTIQNDLFGSSANISAGLKANYQATWSPCLPAVVATCSFDRSVQFYSMSGVKSSIGRAPKWLRRTVGASFGFGGKLVIYDTNKANIGSNNKSTKVASVLQVVEDITLVQSCDKFHHDIATADMSTLCTAKASTTTSLHDKEVWGIMKVLFEKDAREFLVKHLGFDSQAIAVAADEFIRSKNYQIFFSFLLGLFIVLVVRPSCKNESCIKHINPSSQDISASTYQLGSKCYQFKYESVVCE